ncbi:hypothetical protein MARA_52410 [Mycolicibacterium arabiense]|jgi:hypothetical protein|uniref:DUF5666 domain-containing protein n=1 Tax=Mycolicibacterium arabiense TaxID=1286181 RepID=A0A7I7S4Z7_9MYCO|nr:hypothetical protein [Mycolicibacterium arabiense]MCV7373044.1 hypothetical protein [Mycolicibacterium arabiense]BBY51773.1 hypothetical protein MARA_52410 [Mycolicibacterium arabiense]
MGKTNTMQDREMRRTVTIFLTISFAVVFASVTAAILARTADPAPTAAPAQQVQNAAVPHVEQSISQEGRLIDVTPTSVTAQGVDGVARTYLVNADTNAITAAGSRVGDTAGAFTVNDEVAIVGVVRDGTAVATAVAHREVTALNGPPMDAVTP